MMARSWMLREVVVAVCEVEVQALDPARLEPIIGPERLARFETSAERTRSMLQGKAIVNVNSTASGGGVAEMLQTLLAYVRGAGIDTRWVVIRGESTFFDVTKRIHNGLYGSAGEVETSAPPSGWRTTARCAEMAMSWSRWCDRVMSWCFMTRSQPDSPRKC